MKRLWIAAILAAAAGPLWAQQAIHTDAATQPGAGRPYLRQHVEYWAYGDDPVSGPGGDREVTEWVSLTELTYGLTGNLSVRASVPVILRRADSPATQDDTDFGTDDLTLTLRYRAWQNDFGPVDTARLMLIAGSDVPTGSDPFSSDHLQPLLGMTFTYIHDRHGFSVAGVYKFNFESDSDKPYIRPDDGGGDFVTGDVSYLYRLQPEQYREDSVDALYAVLEVNTVFDTGGEYEVFVSPGLLYEARQFAAEVSVQLPVAREVELRPELDFTVTVGFRWLF